MTLTLGDAFNRRKKLASDLTNWVNRLSLAGKEQYHYRTQELEGEQAYAPDPGTERRTRREYTVEECRAEIARLLAEDEELALRISRTNQRARARIVGLDGSERELSIPELLVLKDDIIPKLERAARSVPLRQDDVDIIDSGGNWVRHRTVKRVERTHESFSDKGLKVTESELLGYDVVETTDYGLARRGQWDEIDRIADYAQRVKQAINKANQTELVELD